jgi:hypothetical protein
MKRIRIENNVGDVSGYVASDTVEIAGFKLEKQSFAAVTKADLPDQAPFTGGFGLSFAKGVHGSVSPFLNMVKSKMLKKNLFSIWLREYRKPTGGSITFGKIDTSRYTGKITWHPVAPGGDWQLELKSFRFGPLKYSTGPIAVVDPSSSVIVVPVATARGTSVKERDCFLTILAQISTGRWEQHSTRIRAFTRLRAARKQSRIPCSADPVATQGPRLTRAQLPIWQEDLPADSRFLHRRDLLGGQAAVLCQRLPAVRFLRRQGDLGARRQLPAQVSFCVRLQQP